MSLDPMFTKPVYCLYVTLLDDADFSEDDNAMIFEQL